MIDNSYNACCEIFHVDSFSHFDWTPLKSFHLYMVEKEGAICKLGQKEYLCLEKGVFVNIINNFVFIKKEMI